MLDSTTGYVEDRSRLTENEREALALVGDDALEAVGLTLLQFGGGQHLPT